MHWGSRIFLVAGLSLIPAGVALAAPKPTKPPAPTNEDCLACHEDPAATRADGGALGRSLELLSGSVHGQAGVSCTDCHADLQSAELPHAEKLAAPDCTSCHSDQGEKQQKSVHSTRVCGDCHGSGHGILPVGAEESPVAHLNVPRTCEKCHQDAGLGKTLKDGFHMGRILAENEQMAPVCSTCHGAHDILPPRDLKSHVNRAVVADTCSACHSGQADLWHQSVHGKAVAAGLRAATCSDCHAVHGVSGQDQMPQWRVAVVQECSTCHSSKAETYRDTFHGKVTSLGYSRVASCSDCHGKHSIQPEKDRRSPVSPQRRLETCRKCHPTATENFAKYDPHANEDDPERNPLLHAASLFMKTLLIGVFTFFGLHTALWAPRSYKDRKARASHSSRARPKPSRATAEPARAPEPDQEELSPATATETTANQAVEGTRGEWIERFAAIDRATHAVLFSSFLGLSLTGLPLLFADAPWARTMAGLLGGYGVTGTLHRVFGFVMLFCFSFHVARITIRTYRKRGPTMLWGPESLVPQPRDAMQMLEHIRYFLGRGPRPRFDRYTYWEKFDYWAVFWGMGIIGGSGLLLAFPVFFSRVVPGTFFNLALLVHGEEALLAMVFIFTIHFFNENLRPEKFPMDTVMFTGRISVEELREERPAEHARLVESGRLESGLVGPPSRRLDLIGRCVGTVAISLGILMVVLTLVALLG